MGARPKQEGRGPATLHKPYNKQKDLSRPAVVVRGRWGLGLGLGLGLRLGLGAHGLHGLERSIDRSN